MSQSFFEGECHDMLYVSEFGRMYYMYKWRNKCI